jgi:hypothetical protein
MARVTSNLFEQSSLIEAACLDRAPLQFAHQFFQTAAGAGSSVALSNVKEVEDRRSGDPLHSIATYFATQPLQWQRPGVGGLWYGFGFEGTQFL